MIKEKHTYPVCLMTASEKRFLLWQDRGKEADRFVTLPKTSRFLMANTLKMLLKRAAKLGLQVDKQEPALIDLDAMWRVLSRLRPSHPTSKKTSQVLLEGWNMLEDMARSVSVQIDKEDPRERTILKKAYDKLFYGNNLPSVTPANRSYSPIFSAKEIASMRNSLRRLWWEICERSDPSGHRES